MALESCSFNGAELPLEQCQKIVEGFNAYAAGQTNMFNMIIGSPFFWIMCSVLIVMVGAYLIWGRKDKGDPSTKPFYGVEVRQSVMKKQMDKRLDTLGASCKYHLKHGPAKIGLAEKVEHDYELMFRDVVDKKTKAITYVPDYYYAIERYKFRKYGFVAWIKALFGSGYEYLAITPSSHNKPVPVPKKHKEMVVEIDPMAHIINDSGVWSLSQVDIYKSNKDLILKVDLENQMGSGLDQIRKLSVHQASAAIAMDKMSHEQRLKDEERAKRIAPYS